ncbi:dnaJ homolog subfamily C member 24-like [Malaya genurostris]|uniref:dnaJ homolog subfamily C member 24-like n=1 Tax=Malaya genurostris TaxID=325434 RepID=UPI0026F3E47B|nr:dnaJ homolog subfamily C member 24-like [Malaya genurostris]
MSQSNAESISQPNSSSELSHYEVLQVAPNANFDEIRKSYQSLALRLHPDKMPNSKGSFDRDSVTIDFVRIDEAWKVLRDVDSRRVYDAELMQRTFREEYFVNENLTGNDFQLHEGKDYRYHVCRCGGLYVLPEGLTSGDKCYLSCDECSLVVEMA